MSEQIAFDFEAATEQKTLTEEQRTAMTRWAHKRERRIAEQGLNRARTGTPAEEAALSADWRTSLADARAAVAIAGGAAVDDINPATGRLHNERAYETHRKGWQRDYDRAIHGLTGSDPDHLIKEAEAARQEFLLIRPDLDDGAPWIQPRRYSH